MGWERRRCKRKIMGGVGDGRPTAVATPLVVTNFTVNGVAVPPDSGIIQADPWYFKAKRPYQGNYEYY